jgi:hypothetical protein
MAFSQGLFERNGLNKLFAQNCLYGGQKNQKQEALSPAHKKGQGGGSKPGWLRG